MGAGMRAEGTAVAGAGRFFIITTGFVDLRLSPKREARSPPYNKGHLDADGREPSGGMFASTHLRCKAVDSALAARSQQMISTF